MEHNNRIETNEEKDRELEDKSIETIQSKEQKEKDFKKWAETQEPMGQYQKI